MIKRIAIYARVSTKDQSADMQLLELRNYARRRELQIYKEYIDQGISGTKEKRPALDELMNDARKRRFDAVLVWKFDRFARSLKHLIVALEEFKALGIDFLSLTECIDTSTPHGEAFFGMIGIMAKLERDLIAERIKAGIRNAKEKGIKLGRPSVNIDIDKLRQLYRNSLSIRQIAGQLNISKTKVCELLTLDCVRNVSVN